jgi:hypothetical protein
MNRSISLVILAAPEELEALAPLVREGVEILVPAGRSLRATMEEDLGLGRECVDARVRAVFLDGSPVDDIDGDCARPGCTLALAGALPGVAGICMERESRIGVYREGITHAAPTPASAKREQLRMTLKLFNTIAAECLAQVLAKGVELRAARLAELLDERPWALAGAKLSLEGAEVTREALADALRGRDATLRLVAEPQAC